MASRKDLASGQGELIIIAEQSGQMYTPDFYDQLGEGQVGDLAVPIVEHYIHLQNVITYLGKVSGYEGLVKYDNASIAGNQTHMPEPMRINVEYQRAQAAGNANTSFALATRSQTLEGSFNKKEIREAEALDSQLFSEFMKKYYGIRHYVEAQAYRRKLVNNVRILQQAPQTLYNREQGLRPHAVSEQATAPAIVDSAERQLNTQGRLRAIKEDSRAGFMPTTNREKDQVIAFLDYLDNPDYPYGVNNQFLEVFTHAQKLRRTNATIDSERGPVSIVYEFGDYLVNATKERKALEDLELLLNDMPNLRVTLHEEQDWISLDHPGLAALLRYRDLDEVLRMGGTNAVKSPLLTKEYRWTREGPGKHKIIEDRYTAVHNIAAPFKKYVEESISSMTVGEARRLIGPAVADQVMREAFMTERLEEISTPPLQMWKSARKVLETASNAAQEILEELQAA
jgi:hypothetical protein